MHLYHIAKASKQLLDSSKLVYAVNKKKLFADVGILSGQPMGDAVTAAAMNTSSHLPFDNSAIFDRGQLVASHTWSNDDHDVMSFGLGKRPDLRVGPALDLKRPPVMWVRRHAADVLDESGAVRDGL